MTRIAAAMLIAVAVLALNGGMMREAFAGEAAMKLAPAPMQAIRPLQLQSAKVLSLLLVLEALRQAPTVQGPQKL